ncbi:hypothetical protein ACOSP6_00695 [Tenacibaculum sp. MEBiC06402]|uniref:FEKKY domain-containing protein n=1 Tax=unclassified Tenacibaculum TaxID=2635139 RepID=UPI003B9D24B9
MKRKNKIKVGIGILLLVVLLWQFGFLTRYNYLTAKIDSWRDKPRIVQIGIPDFNYGVPVISLNEKYGFHQTNIGCIVTRAQLRGIESYNTEIEKYLNNRNGKDWRKKYQAELDYLIKNKLTE